jgi:hypothetical protein
MFNKGTISGLADIMFVFNFSPLIVKEVRGNRSRYSISDVPPIERIKGSKVRRMRWPSERPVPANPFLWKIVFNLSLPCGNVEVPCLVGTACNIYFLLPK